MGCIYIFIYTYTSIASDAQSWVRASHIDPYTVLLLSILGAYRQIYSLTPHNPAYAHRDVPADVSPMYLQVLKPLQHQGPGRKKTPSFLTPPKVLSIGLEMRQEKQEIP